VSPWLLVTALFNIQPVGQYVADAAECQRVLDLWTFRARDYTDRVMDSSEFMPSSPRTQRTIRNTLYSRVDSGPLAQVGWGECRPTELWPKAFRERVWIDERVDRPVPRLIAETVDGEWVEREYSGGYRTWERRTATTALMGRHDNGN
jgi:hypothetical protein